jgi:hypothetical protein
MMWKNTVEPARPQAILWRMRIALWIPKATNAHSLQQHCNNGCTKAPKYNGIRTLCLVTLLVHMTVFKPFN